MANALPQLPFKNQIADDLGLMTSPWVGWFRELSSRVGGPTANSNAQLLVLIENLQTQVNNIEGGLTKGPRL